jgi:predicted alpha/beta-hydrolase family hydrolase
MTQLPTRLCRAGGKMAVTIPAIALVAACGGGSGTQTSTRASAQTPPSAHAVPPTTAAAIAKPCFRAAESTHMFRFKTSDGASLVGVVLGTGRTGLVLGHQLGSDLCEWLPQARMFARRGYRVLVFNFADFGDSQPGQDGRVDTDVVAAAAQLRRRGADRIVLIGSSMGGTAMLSAATRIRPPVTGVVSLSGPSGFGGVDAEAAMARLRVPVLFIVAADDRPFREQARLMYRAARMRDKRLLVIPGRRHGTGLLEFGDDAVRVRAAVRGFVAHRTRA